MTTKEAQMRAHASRKMAANIRKSRQMPPRYLRAAVPIIGRGTFTGGTPQFDRLKAEAASASARRKVAGADYYRAKDRQAPRRKP
ncbi:MAG: hypothetical protein ACHQ1G_05795 [Planctomycetota bacterium]